MKFQESTVIRFSFTQQQIRKNLESAFRDYDIARKDCILEVKFTYSYNALIKDKMKFSRLAGSFLRNIATTKGTKKKPKMEFRKKKLKLSTFFFAIFVSFSSCPSWLDHFLLTVDHRLWTNSLEDILFLVES